MGMNPGPIVLLADSQLLFSKKENEWFRSAMNQRLSDGDNFGVYIGVSNGNERAFYEMAKDALTGFGVERCLFLKDSLVDLGDKAQQTPSVIVLSGGDVELGWRLLKQPELLHWIDRSLKSGALLLGISAGAIHLTSAIHGKEDHPCLTRCFDYYPTVTIVHEEAEHWPSERLYHQLFEQDKGMSAVCCLKIPLGSGVWLEGDELVTFGRVPSQLIKGKQTVNMKRMLD